MVGVYYFILNFDKPSEADLEPEKYKIADHEHVMRLQMIGFLIYIAVIAAILY